MRFSPRFRLLAPIAVGLLIGLLIVLLHHSNLPDRFWGLFTFIDMPALVLVESCWSAGLVPRGRADDLVFIFAFMVEWMALGLVVGMIWYSVAAPIRIRYMILGSILLLVTGTISYFLSRQEDYRLADPSGEYTAVVSKRRFQSLVCRMPGQGGDAPGFLEIFGRKGESYGRIPLGMIQYASGLGWKSSGAEIPVISEWDFKRRTCYYWSEDQDRQIWVRR